MARRISIAILLAVAAAMIHTTAGEKYVVGDSLGWLVPPGGPIAYSTWAAKYTFTIGDVLVFNFTTGKQDVARVTKEAFDTCNSTNPISLKTQGPANFTLDTSGEYYFIGTMDQHCQLGQKLAIFVTASSGPSASPEACPPRGPVTYTVGDSLGWLVPPGGAIAYETWAYGKTFIIGDTLVFNFDNGTQDVAMVTKEAYVSCDTNKTISVLTTSPAKITLNTTGEHFFTSTYPRHCVLGQQLDIYVTASSNTTAKPPSSATAPSSSSSTSAGGPSGAPPPVSSAPSLVIAGWSFTFLSIAMAFLY